MHAKVLIVCFMMLCFVSGVTPACTSNTSIGVSHQLEVSLGSSVSICIQLNSSRDLEAIRVSVASENATSRHPVLVTVRQPMGINSWTLPYIESGFAFSSVERTLCPLLNSDDSSNPVLYIDLSTTQISPLSVSLNTALITPFKLQMNTPVSLEASPSGPSYLLYEYENPPTDQHVRVNFQSSGNSSNICAIASIQTAYCPEVEILDNPNHRGTFQTMRSIASITAKENDTNPHFGFFYVVLSVLPNDGEDGSCLSTTKGQENELFLLSSAVNNFNPTPYTGPDRIKAVTITIQLVNPDLPAAITVPIAVYIGFAIAAFVWIAATTYRRKRKSKDLSLWCCNTGSSAPSDDIELSGDKTTKPDENGLENRNSESEQPEIEHSEANGNGNSATIQNGNEQTQSTVAITIGNGNTELNPNQQYGNEQSQSCRFKINTKMSDLGELDDSPARQKKYYPFAWYMLVIVVFFSVPAYQLAVTYQRLLLSSGNEDVCYYNTRCATPMFSTSAFNNIFSNIGYFILGFLYLAVTYLRRRRYRRLEENNAKNNTEKTGIPEAFGIYYAIGFVMIGQALMSIAYHLCPSTNNYQVDVTFMYVMISMGMFKVLTNRAPDLAPALHWQAVYLMTILVVVVVGGVLFEFLVFKIVFICAYLVSAVYFSFLMYYRFKFQHRRLKKSCKEIYALHKEAGNLRPQHPCKVIALLISILLNAVIAFGIFLAESMNIDFARYFLLIILVNFMIFLLYYLIAKIIYKECFTLKVFKPVLYSILAVLLWIPAIYFFTRNVTDTSISPALSRDNNQDCSIFGFYDFHDLWHFLSAFALYFSFILLLTLDEGQEGEPRTKIMTL